MTPAMMIDETITWVFDGMDATAESPKSTGSTVNASCLSFDIGDLFG
jgi:hypothetical protein